MAQTPSATASLNTMLAPPTQNARPTTFWWKPSDQLAPPAIRDANGDWSADKPWKEASVPGTEEGHVAVIVNPNNGTGMNVRTRADFEPPPILSLAFVKRLNQERTDAQSNLDSLDRKLESKNLTPEARQQLVALAATQRDFVQKGLVEKQDQNVENLRLHEQGHLHNSAAVAESANAKLASAKTYAKQTPIFNKVNQVETAVDAAYHQFVGTTVSSDPAVAKTIETWSKSERANAIKAAW
jgi:hypothetical protein